MDLVDNKDYIKWAMTEPSAAIRDDDANSDASQEPTSTIDLSKLPGWIKSIYFT